MSNTPAPAAVQPSAMPMGMMQCPECGAEMPEDAEECPECGAEMDDADEPEEPHEATMPKAKKELTKELIVDSVKAAVPIAETFDENGNAVHRGSLLVSVAERRNRNNRVYPEAVWRREAAKSADKVRDGLLTGQAEHPEGRPELLNTILKFTSLRYDEASKATYAEFDVIPTSKGKDFIEIAKAGVAIGCSTRGTGTIKREKRDGAEVGVIQDDYELQAIDVMLFGEQSVEQARLNQFESVELETTATEPHMPEITTLDALREAYPALLTETDKVLEAEKGRVAELTAQLAGKEAQAAELAQAKAAVETSLTEAQAKGAETAQALEATSTLLEAAKADAVSLREANTKLTEELAVASNRKEALLHLMEVARDQKHAAWLVVEFLKDAPTKAAVDEGLAPAVRKAESLIETTLVKGAGTQVAQPADDNRQPPPETEDLAVQFPNAMSIAFGRRIPA